MKKIIVRASILLLLALLFLTIINSKNEVFASISDPNQKYRDLFEDLNTDTFVNTVSINHYKGTSFNPYFSRVINVLDYSEFLMYSESENYSDSDFQNTHYSELYVYGDSDPDYYERNIVEVYLPYIKMPYNSEKYNQVKTYINDPVFRLDEYTFELESMYIFNVAVLVSTLTETEKEYIESHIQSDIPSFVLQETDTITYKVQFIEDYQIKITLDLSSFLDTADESIKTERLDVEYLFRNNGGSSLDFLLREVIDYDGYLKGDVDLGIDLNVPTNVWGASMRDPEDEYHYIDIPTIGTYMFEFTAGSDCMLIKIMNEDMQLVFDNSQSTSLGVSYVNLYQGEYLIQLKQKYKCSVQPSLTVSQNNREDDYPNTSSPGFEYFYQGEETISFTMNYENDVDVIVFENDFVFLTIPEDAFVIYENAKALVSRAMGNSKIIILEHNSDDPIAVSFKSNTLSNFNVKIETQQSFAGGLNFDNYIEFDVYKVRERYFYIVENNDVGSLYKITTTEDADLFINVNYVDYTIYDSNHNILREPGDAVYTPLLAGEYFIYFHLFNDFAQANGVIKTSKIDTGEVEVVELVDNKLQFSGLIATQEDIDEFLITVEQETIYDVICYDCAYTSYIIVGLDNPTLYLFEVSNPTSIKLDQGQYRIIMNTNSIGVSYDFAFVKTERIDVESIDTRDTSTTIDDLETITYDLEYDYFNDTETIIITFTNDIEIKYDYPLFLRATATVYIDGMDPVTDTIFSIEHGWVQTYKYFGAGEIHISLQSTNKYSWLYDTNHQVEVVLVIDHDLTN